MNTTTAEVQPFTTGLAQLYIYVDNSCGKYMT